jgi:hypothetical protein
MRRDLIIALTALAVSMPIVRSTAQDVGYPEWLAPRARGTPPARPARDLELGTALSEGEEILTAERGAIDIVFTESNARLLIGPSCATRLDASHHNLLTQQDERAVAVTTRTRCLVRADATLGSSFLREVAPGASDAVTLLTPLAVIYILGAEAVVDLQEAQAFGARDGAKEGKRGANTSPSEPRLLLAGFEPPMRQAQVRPAARPSLRVTKLTEAGRVVLVSGENRRALTRAGETWAWASVTGPFEGPAILSGEELAQLLGRFEGLATPLPLEVEVALPSGAASPSPFPGPRLPNPCLATAACTESRKEALRDAPPVVDGGGEDTPSGGEVTAPD